MKEVFEKFNEEGLIIFKRLMSKLNPRVITFREWKRQREIRNDNSRLEINQ